MSNAAEHAAPNALTTVGFSVAGLIVSLAILAPNLVLLGWPARDQPVGEPSPGMILTVLERAGQACCLVLPALTGGSPHLDLWLLAVVLLIAAYYGLWVRFFLSGRQFDRLYAPLGPIPIPMALFPVLAFFAAAGWLNSWWLAAGALILAVGHIGTSWLTYRYSARDR